MTISCYKKAPKQVSKSYTTHSSIVIILKKGVIAGKITINVLSSSAPPLLP